MKGQKVMFKEKLLICLLAIGMVAKAPGVLCKEFVKIELTNAQVIAQAKIQKEQKMQETKPKTIEKKDARAANSKVKIKEKGTQTQPMKGKYVPKEILYLTWGDGKYQVGVQDAYELKFVGPQEIKVDDKGNILILDTVNGRILIYSNEGKFINKIDFVSERDVDKWGESFCIRKDGTIYVRVGFDIILYDKDGKFLRKWKGPSTFKDREKRIPGRLRLDKEDNLIGLAKNGEFRKIQFDEERCWLSEEIKSPFTQEVKIKDWKSLIFTLDEKQKLTKKIEIDNKKNYVIGNIIGEDKDQNIYIRGCLIATKEMEESRYEVRKYSKEGNLLATVELSPPEIDEGIKERWVDVDKDGNIYYLRTLETGIKVIKYELQ